MNHSRLEPLLTVDEAAELLGVSKSTLRQWTYDGKLGYVPLGRRKLFEPAALRAFIAARRRTPSEKANGAP